MIQVVNRAIFIAKLAAIMDVTNANLQGLNVERKLNLTNGAMSAEFAEAFQKAADAPQKPLSQDQIQKMIELDGRPVMKDGKKIGSTLLSETEDIILQIIANNTPEGASRQLRRKIDRDVRKKMKGIKIV